jgi:hypothetical protein
MRAACQGAVEFEVDTVADIAESPHDRKPFRITLDTVYMDNCGVGINII